MSKDGVVQGKGLLNAFTTKHAIKLLVSLSDIDILLYPSEQDASNDIIREEEKVTTIVVHIHLIVPSQVTPPDSIAALTVEFKADETLGFPSGLFERNTPHQILKVVESAKGMQIQSGEEYHWDVPLDINASTAPYARGIYGRLFHKVKVTLEWPKFKGWLKGGKSLISETDVFLASVPPSINVTSYAHTHNGFTEALGPVIFHTRSRQLSVGGYLRTALKLPSCSSGIKLVKLTLTLIQNTTLVSRKDSSHIEHCQPEKIDFWSVEEKELEDKMKRATGTETEDSLDAEWIARLPRDHQSRCSSLVGDQAAIRHDHLLEVRLTYRKPDQMDKVHIYSANWPLLLPACILTWRHMKLPSYSEHDASPVPDWNRGFWEPDKYANIHLSQTTCACGQSLEKLMTWEDEGDDEDNTSTSRMLRESIRSASSSLELERRSRSRSRSRNRLGPSGLSRDSSARPSLDMHRESEMEDDDDNDGDDQMEDADEERENRRQQKLAQQYTTHLSPELSHDRKK